MLVFSTRLPLKDNVTQEDCLNLFIEWITESPHYTINSIDYDVKSHEDFGFENENIIFNIKHVNNEQVYLSACRLENREEDAVWINDCIFLCENGVNSLLVQLNCNRTEYNTQLPHTHKPYIIRKFVENGMCRSDGGIPVSDYPIEVDEKYYDICVQVMRGTYEYSMPVVYISCDYEGNYVISPDYLAKRLSGVAHVFVEKDRETSLKLRKDTDSNNAYSGYIGIYFPGTKFCQKHGMEYYYDYKELGNEIVNSVWKALINRMDASVYNWNQIIALQTRQRMCELQDISENSKKQLSEYMDVFDVENESLMQQISELNMQVFSLRSQLDALKLSIKESEKDDCFYHMGKEPCLYPSERNDLLYSILSQVQKNYDVNSRGYVLIKSLLDANPHVGECANIIAEVRSAFSGEGKLTSTKKAQLKKVGFRVEEDGPHIKVIFHDSRYMFTIPKTPSDHREGKNMISDICKIVDIERKI